MLNTTHEDALYFGTNDRYDGFDRGDLDHPENWETEDDLYVVGNVTMAHAVSTMVYALGALIRACDVRDRFDAGDILF